MSHSHHNSHDSDDYMHKAKEFKDQAYDKAKSIAHELEDKLKDAGVNYEEIKGHVDEVSKDLIKHVRKRPVVAIGVAVACGFLLGRILK